MKLAMGIIFGIQLRVICSVGNYPITKDKAISSAWVVHPVEKTVSCFLVLLLIVVHLLLSLTNFKKS